MGVDPIDEHKNFTVAIIFLHNGMPCKIFIAYIGSHFDPLMTRIYQQKRGVVPGYTTQKASLRKS
ncbi:MAG: hypothetical protein CM15mP62_32500 [Rhodospirillaceae bacterium]|nr:MAG: hypothetical protein CM15mP62_32500 [Rhodospirillaceae bacterium]